jgi:hypothetical protein
VVVAIAITAVVGAGAPVGAAPVDRGHFHDVGSELLEGFCGDLNMLHSWDVSGSFLGVARGPDGLVHYRDSVGGTDVWTNVDTGKSYTGKWTSNSRDLKVTDNGDGTLTILVQASGGEQWYDANGKVVLRNPGLIRWEILVDDGGTPTDPFDDGFIAFLGVVKGSTGRNDTDGRDFCEDLHIFTD